MTKKHKILLCLAILLLLILLIFMLVANFEHKIYTDKNGFNVSEVNRIIFYNGNEKLVLNKNDEEFQQIISVFENKSIKNSDAVRMAYKDYKIRLSNSFCYIDLFPELTNVDNDFLRIGNSSSITGKYNYLNISSADNEILFNCYEQKTGNTWTLIENK